MNKLNTRGDTIVEVLISIAVVSFVLGAAYVSANRSLQGSRQAQERAEATKLSEAQLERLQIAAEKHPTGDPESPFGGGTAFCIADDLTTPDLASTPPADFQTDNLSSPPPSGRYPDTCKFSLNNGGYYYFASVERANGTTFIIRIRWNRIGGAGNEEVKMYYKAHP